MKRYRATPRTSRYAMDTHTLNRISSYRGGIRL